MKVATLLIPLFLLCTVTISQTSQNVEVVDTSVTGVSSVLGNDVLSRIPVSRNASGLLQIAPGQAYPTNIPSNSSITGTAQFIDGVELQVLARVDGPTSTLQFCDLKEIEVLCAPKGNNPLGLSPGLQYGGNANNGVVNFITRSGNTEFSQGRAVNPNASRFKSAKFPFYTPPEKDFPLGVISSAGVSGDASASFQIINFPGDSYFFFRENNSQLRPTGPFIKYPLGNVGFISSGTLSNRIDNLSGGPDYRFFGYRQYFNVGTPNVKSQVKLQVYNADTWAKIGNPFNYTPQIKSRYFNEEQSQSVEIDPGGAFLAYTKYHGASDRNLGYIRGISPMGSPQKQKLFTPINLMRDTDSGIYALDVIRVTTDVVPE